MGRPTVLLFSVRGKLQSLQPLCLHRSWLGPMKPLKVPSDWSLKLSRTCQPISFCLGEHHFLFQTAAAVSQLIQQHVCVSVWVCVTTLSSTLPSFSSMKPNPTLLSTHIPHFLTHLFAASLSHTHTHTLKYTLTHSCHPAAACCVWVTGESYTSVFVFSMQRRLFCSRFCFSPDSAQQDKEGRSWFPAAESGLLLKVMTPWPSINTSNGALLLLHAVLLSG